jgi:hypothetical protein
VDSRPGTTKDLADPRAVATGDFLKGLLVGNPDVENVSLLGQQGGRPKPFIELRGGYAALELGEDLAPEVRHPAIGLSSCNSTVFPHLWKKNCAGRVGESSIVIGE